MQDVYTGFVGSFGLNVRMMNEMCNVRTIEIEPKPGTLLHFPAAPNATCVFPLDYVIAPLVIVTHAWDGETIRLARSIIENRFESATLIDIGANTGLFTRQMLIASPEFDCVFAYEPHPANFRCLQHNTSPFENVRLNNYALGPDDGTLKFYMDPDNCGNYSLNPSAMPAARECATILVSVKSVREEAGTWLEAKSPIFYKSDTQGYDEVIASAVGTVFWDSVFGGLLELWRIEKPDWSSASMVALLDKFPNKRFVNSPAVPISTSDILAYLAGKDGAFQDVIFWK